MSDLPGMPESEWHIVEAMALRDEGMHSEAARVGYEATRAQLRESLQELHTDIALPDFEPDESLTEYMNRVNVLFEQKD
jgi:predicted DNA-binding ArsR family transcriptional regulator